MEYPKYYALTWNPRPKAFTFDESDERLLFKEHVSIIKYIKYMVFMMPEFSDNYKLHYHGLAVVNNDDEYIDYQKSIRRIVKKGFIKSGILIKKGAVDRWIHYCGKTWLRTKSILFDRKDPIQYTKLTVKELIRLCNEYVKDVEKPKIIQLSIYDIMKPIQEEPQDEEMLLP